MKPTSSHTSSFKGQRKERDHLEILDRSEEPSKVEQVQKIKEEEDEVILPYEIEHQLEMNIEKYSEEVKDQLKYLLLDLLKYPSTKQAVRHRAANRLGYHDLKNIKNKFTGHSTYTTSHSYSDYCEDCDLLIQEKEISTCSSLWQFPKAGLGTYTLYRNMKLIMAMLFILGIIYCIINLVVNIKYITTDTTSSVTGTTYPALFVNVAQILNSSVNSALQTALNVSGFLLLITVIVWWLTIIVTTCLSSKYEREVDQAHLSPSDFSIMLENVPIHYSEEKLKEEFNRYFQSLVFNHNIKNTWGEVLHRFTIRKICRTVPFALSESEVFDKELEGLDRDILEKKKLFAEWVLEMKYNSRFTYTKAQRDREYLTFQRMIERRKRKLKQMEIKAREQYERANDRIKTTLIITFDYNQSASIIEYLNPQTIPAKIRYILSFCKSTQYFDIRDYITNSESDIIVSKAPEPEDIVWGNVAVPLSIQILRKLLVWGAMILLSGILLAIIYGISFAQKNGTGIWSSVFIGFLVSFFNMLTKFTLRKISPYEKDFTETERQRGILLKSLFVMAFNYIIPIVVTNVDNESSNYFGLNGLAYEVFYISFFECLLPPLVRIFDPEHLFRQIRAWIKSRAQNKIVLKQSELNDYLEHEEYQLGWCYIYFLNMLFFSCFYVTLYPGIVIFSLSGCFFMFWAQKYCLLNRSQRPEKIAHTLNNTVQTLLSIAPFILWLGHLIWINAMIQDFSSTVFTGNMILMSVSLLYFLTPWKGIYTCLFHIPEEETLYYDHCRTKFTTEYDRLNPATIEAGFNDYNNHLKGRKNKEEESVSDEHMNKSEENLIQPFDTRYVLQEISKIPSIFGRKNQVSRKIDRENNIQPRNIKGEDIQLLVVNQNREESPARHNNSVVQVNTKQSPSEHQGKKNIEAEEIRKKEKEEKEEEYFSHSNEDTQKKGKLNVSSTGNVYGKRKQVNDKRKTISVIDKPQQYDYQRRSNRP